MLSLGHFGAPLRRLIRMLQLAGDETLIALEQEFERFSGRHRGRMDRGNHRTRRDDRQRGYRKQQQYLRQNFVFRITESLPCQRYGHRTLSLRH